MKFRKKPVEVEAVQFTEELLWWYILEDKPLPEGLWVEGLDYNLTERKIKAYSAFSQVNNDVIPVRFGDWIIYEPEPEGTKIYTDEYFKQTYEPIVEIF